MVSVGEKWKQTKACSQLLETNPRQAVSVGSGSCGILSLSHFRQ